jgi:hypothetical protein
MVPMLLLVDTTMRPAAKVQLVISGPYPGPLILSDGVRGRDDMYRSCIDVQRTFAGRRLTHKTGMRCDAVDHCRRSVIGARQCSDLG